MDFIADFKNHLKARYPLLLIQTSEEDRLFSDIRNVAKELNSSIYTWSAASGLCNAQGEIINDATMNLKSAIDICEQKAKNKENGLFVFFDAESILLSENASLIIQRRMKEFALNIRTKGYRCNCVLVSFKTDMASPLSTEITVLDYPLPSREEVKKQIQKFMNLFKNKETVKIDTSNETVDALTAASLGLTTAEIDNCLSRALVEDHCLNLDDVKSIVQEKKQIIRKSGVLEYIDVSMSLNDIGGLEVLKKWLKIRGDIFSDDAKDFGLQPPKGVLLVGIPGCGKSLTAKCIASSWNMPLLKLDIGKIFGKYIGESEANIRQALKTAEAIAPCVLWIDEIEKGFASTDSDGGTSSRVFGNILTWMQDKNAPVFTFATGNNINKLPPELLRKGRFDEIFFVDFPDYEERKKILSIHISKIKRNIKDFDLDKLAKLSGEECLGKDIRLAGAELEAWVKDALMEAYTRKINGNQNADLSMYDFETVIKRMVPMAKIRAEDFKSLRNWANENAVSASKNYSETDDGQAQGGRSLDLL